jgi:RNA 3'-terminal phosphate cyclase (ATP)
MLHITGGTDVRWSPTIDYFQNATMPALRLFGFKGDLQLESRGFNPMGGDKVTAFIEPAKLHGIRADVPQLPSVRGISAACSHLPPHVVKRQADAARKYLESMGIEVAEITLDIRKDPAEQRDARAGGHFLGGSALSERGVPAEKVGAEAVSIIANEKMTGRRFTVEKGRTVIIRSV